MCIENSKVLRVGMKFIEVPLDDIAASVLEKSFFT